MTASERCGRKYVITITRQFREKCIPNPNDYGDVRGFDITLVPLFLLFS